MERNYDKEIVELVESGLISQPYETEKAILLYVYNNYGNYRKVWLPKSQITVTPLRETGWKVLDDDKTPAEIIKIPKWLAKKNGIPTSFMVIPDKTVKSLLREYNQMRKKEREYPSKRKTKNTPSKKASKKETTYRLLARLVALDPYEPETFYKKGKFPFWLLTDPDGEIWDRSKGRLVGLKPAQIGNIYKVGKNAYVVEYTSSSDFYAQFVQSEEKGEPVEMLSVEGLDIDERTDEIRLTKTEKGWKLSHLNYME